MSTRGLRRGKATRTLAGVSNPLNSTGIDGDIRVVETSKGPKLKVRSKGKWWTADLRAETEVDVFTPKLWVSKGKTRSGPGNQYIYLPKYVSNQRIVGISFGISLGGFERTYFSLGSNGAYAKYNIFIHYNKANKYIRIEIGAAPGGDGTSVDNKEYTMAVIYEG